MIYSLPNSLEQLKHTITHNEGIQKLEDLSRSIELEAEHRVPQE
jgi:hypothetical protein